MRAKGVIYQQESASFEERRLKALDGVDVKVGLPAFGPIGTTSRTS